MTVAVTALAKLPPGCKPFRASSMKPSYAVASFCLILNQSAAAQPAAAQPATPTPATPAAPPPIVPGGCGDARPDLAGIPTAEGLVIAPDGTIYFTQPFGDRASPFLGRYRPPYTAPELRWVEVGPKALGLALDPQRGVLYVGSRERQKLLAVFLSEYPQVLELADAEPAINGVTLGKDGAVYYTDQKGGHVYRVTFEGAKTRVTAAPIEDPNGLAFGPDGKLYVLSYAAAKITRLTLKAGKEIARAPFVDIPGGKNADGIAFDKQRRMYVTATSLFRVDLPGKTVTPLGEAYGANAEFGIGALGCADLYTAGNGKGLHRFVNDTPGMDVPWHRPVVRPKETVPRPSPPRAVPKRLAAAATLELVTDATTEAVGIVAAPGEPVGRLFVIEKAGPIRVLRGKTFDPKPFLDLTGKVSLWNRPNGEQGLLGLAFHPDFQTNRRLFIHYTDLQGQTRVVEYRADKADPNRADPASARDLLVVPQPYGNHNAGHLEFGPDNKLYVLLGDGGKAGDPHGFAQDRRSLLGKMLRLDVDAARPEPEVLGSGLRNPWRYTFDRATGDLYIADVGQNVFEYVHFVPAKHLAGPHNFGWNILEGTHCFQARTCNRRGLARAVVEYPHSEGCSITGGHVYRGKALPELAGHYFYSDYCTAILRSVRMKGGKAGDAWDWKLALDPDMKLAQVAAFGEDQDGELHVVTHAGAIYKLVRR